MVKKIEKGVATQGEYFLLLTAFIAGFVVMALEITAFRIFAPYFGFSIFVSGTLIGIVMVALSLGYYLGGKLADKKGDPRTIFNWIFYAMVYVFVTLVSYKIILAFFSEMFITGVIVSSIVIFGFPMVVLSMVTPYLIKLISKSGSVGSAAGSINAVGTVGAILGTFIPTFFLIPYLGSFATYAISALLLLMIVILYFARGNKWFLLNLLFIFAIFFQPTNSDENIIFTEESAYNLIKVVQGKGSQYQLRLNDNGNIQSIYEPDSKFDKDFYFYYLNTAPLMNGASSVLVLGMGAGTSPYQMIKLHDVQVDAVEIDPKIVGVAQEYFGLDEVKDNLNIFVDDARSFLKKVDKRYGVIEVDMYQGGLYAPFYVLTQEFFQEAEEKLNHDGIVALNVLYHSKAKDGSLLFDSIGNTVASVFENVFYLDLHNSNIILFATNEDVTLAEVQGRIIENAPEKMELHQEIAGALQRYQPTLDAEILTDDKSPLDQLTYKVVSSLSAN